MLYVDRVWSSDLTIDDAFELSLEQMVVSTRELIEGSSMTSPESMPP